MKEEVGGLVVGGFEPTAKPWVAPDALPYPFEFQLLEEDWDHFSVLMESAVHRIPALQHTGLKKLYNGPESFTPDNQFILGEAPGLAGLLRRSRVQLGRHRVGRWRRDGRWPSGSSKASRRATSWPSTYGASPRSTPTTDGCGTGWGRSSACTTPCRGPTGSWRRPARSAVRRSITCSPTRGRSSVRRWDGSGPTSSRPSGVPAELDYTWGRPEWLAWSAAEQTATRERVAVFDETSFGKLLVVGRDAETVLQRLCTADVAVEPGRAVYTGMLNERAGYEADVTVTRLAADRYLLVTSAASPVRDAAWIERHLASRRARLGGRRLFRLRRPRRDGAGVAPAARAASARPTCPTRRSRSRRAGRSPSATPPCGPPGSPTSASWAGSSTSRPSSPSASTRTSLRPEATSASSTPGYSAINSLRLDKGYRAFGSDLTPDYTPLEAGLRFTCKLATPIDFVGRRRLEAAVEAGPRRRLVSLRVGDPDAMLWGGELVLHDGAPAGQVSSAAWSATCGAAVGLAYVWRPDRGPVGADDLAGGTWEVTVGDAVTTDRRPSRGALRPDVSPGPGLSDLASDGHQRWRGGTPVSPDVPGAALDGGVSDAEFGVWLERGRLHHADEPAGTLAFSEQAGTSREEDHGEDRGLRPRLRQWPTTSTRRTVRSGGSNCSATMQHGRPHRQRRCGAERGGSTAGLPSGAARPDLGDGLDPGGGRAARSTQVGAELAVSLRTFCGHARPARPRCVLLNSGLARALGRRAGR